jgi:hypothetical protein
MISSGLGLLTLATVSGVLLARARWSRWMTLVVSGLWFASAVAPPLHGAAAATIAASTAAASIAAGPWLGRWLRHLPATSAPPPSAVVVLLMLIATPAVIGFTEGGAVPEPVGWALAGWSTLLALGLARAVGWALAGWSTLLALGLARAVVPALWLGRFAHAPLSAFAGLMMGLPTAVALLGKAAVETLIMWRRDLHLAVSPLMSERVTAVPIPPELVDPELLRAAGLDDSGRPLDDS